MATESTSSASNRPAEPTSRSTLKRSGERGAVSVTRLEATPQLVFDALTQCEHLKNWIGADGRDLVACECDIRTGGRYRHEFGSPSGRRFVMFGDYVEVRAPTRIMHTESYEGYSWEPLTVTTQIESNASGSTLTIEIEYASTAVRDEDFPNLEHSLAGYGRLNDYLQRAK